MKIIRKKIFNNFKWLKSTNKNFIISADYDGLICSAFLSHFLKWNLVGYYNMEKIWISKEGIHEKKDLIWVDLDILPKAGKTLGGHIAIFENEIPKGLKTSCNPNIIRKLSNNDFQKKYPLSTLSFLMWMFNVPVPSSSIAKFLILHSDATWLKYQRYSKNFNEWTSILNNYDWNLLLQDINTINFEKEIDQKFYPLIIRSGASSGFSKLKSKHLNIKSREYKFNPDWDEDVILNLFDLFGQYLSWSPPILPNIYKKINGHKKTISLNEIKKIGLNKFIKNNKIFSYAITSPKTLKYTMFDKIK